MGNSKSSSMAILHKSFDDYYIDNKMKQNDSKCFDDYFQLNDYPDDDDDGQTKISELKRGRSLKTKRINHHNSNNHPPQSAQNFKRINSLPPVSRLQRKQRQPQSTNELIESKQLHKGFDMIRHHFGQKDCEWTSSRLTELETSILLLNDKPLPVHHHQSIINLPIDSVRIMMKFQSNNNNYNNRKYYHQKN
ncbi:hypothetical protein BLA29_005054 [Euroglyphus maynei]|uniref:Uncharacterized protein n=1 Tax=Euroglyphus maynei TaxID=6958 RepID=A0A1Y3BB09_EURMA|nr:hypothetical protein BLA29_005054 [Euroglyphus maynei]